MQSLEERDVQKRIKTEIRWCFTFEDGGRCAGASGRKRRETCVWCPNYQKGMEKGNEKDH